MNELETELVQIEKEVQVMEPEAVVVNEKRAPKPHTDDPGQKRRQYERMAHSLRREVPTGPIDAA
eukprot:4679926-Amphidinium_carterae.1